MKVINIFGGPGVGKSVLAARVFIELKIAGYRVKLIEESARELMEQGVQDLSYCTKLIFNENHNKLKRAKEYGTYDFVVVDAPLILPIVYAPPDMFWLNKFIEDSWVHFERFDNINFFLVRNPKIKYDGYDRLHDESEALEIDLKVFNLLSRTPYKTINSDDVEFIINEAIKA